MSLAKAGEQNCYLKVRFITEASLGNTYPKREYTPIDFKIRTHTSLSPAAMVIISRTSFPVSLRV